MLSKFCVNLWVSVCLIWWVVVLFIIFFSVDFLWCLEEWLVVLWVFLCFLCSFFWCFFLWVVWIFLVNNLWVLLWFIFWLYFFISGELFMIVLIFVLVRIFMCDCGVCNMVCISGVGIFFLFSVVIRVLLILSFVKSWLIL